MPDLVLIHLDSPQALGLVALGLCAGIMGSFVGGGGALVMVPGLMSVGAEGLVAVGTSLLHRLGRVATSPRRRAAFGKLDTKMLVVLGIPSIVGVEAGRRITSLLRDAFGQGASDLYLSVLLMLVLAGVTWMLAADLFKRRQHAIRPMSAPAVTQRIRPFRAPPLVAFPASSVVVSLWLVLGIGLVAGLLAGSIGLGGFLTVPALIYLLGSPASIATATDMALVLIVGAYGALSYAFAGAVDLRATLLLYAGSILGFHLGMLATRLVREEPIRLLTCVVLALLVVNRGLALPTASAACGWIELSGAASTVLRTVSLILLFAGAAMVGIVVIGAVARAAVTGRARLLRPGDAAGEEE